MNLKKQFSLILFFLAGQSAWAHPFRGNQVCIPPLDPNSGNLEFRVRDGGACAAGDRWMSVHRNSQGIVLIMPSAAPTDEVPLTPEQEDDLKKAKQFYQGE